MGIDTSRTDATHLDQCVTLCPLACGIRARRRLQVLGDVLQGTACVRAQSLPRVLEGHGYELVDIAAEVQKRVGQQPASGGSSSSNNSVAA